MSIVKRSPRRTVGHSPRRTQALIVRYAVLTGVLAISIGPLLWQLSSSLKGPGEALFGTEATLFPQDPSFAAYATVFEQVPMSLYIRNSLIMCLLTVASQVVFPTLAPDTCSPAGSGEGDSCSTGCSSSR
jgi:multiple sugar transport system permease protein